MMYSKTRETFGEGDGHLYHLTTIPCPFCRKTAEITVKGSDLHRYHQGAFIQDAFPSLSAADRERLMTGICGPCFTDMWKEGEEG